MNETARLVILAALSCTKWSWIIQANESPRNGDILLLVWCGKWLKLVLRSSTWKLSKSDERYYLDCSDLPCSQGQYTYNHTEKSRIMNA